MAALVDHLWQSLLLLAVCALLSLLLRDNSARVRLWLWRIAALKFLVPFALFHAVGGWLGLPVSHVSDPAPAFLLDWVSAARRVFAPAESVGLAGNAVVGASGLLLMIALGWAPKVVAQIKVERLRAHREILHLLREPAARPARSVGFFKAALMTALVFAVSAGPLLAGAVDDHQHRRELLIANSLSLRTGTVDMKVAAPGMGTRARVIADDQGVLVRNASLMDLVSLVYGVSKFSVFGDQMVSSDDAGVQSYWLLTPRYDVRVTAPLREPEDFDPYALRQVVTRLIAERFGSEIHMNGKCQPPCGRYGVPLADDPL